MFPDTAMLIFYLAMTEQKVNIDYTPQWGRGNPQVYIDNVTFPRVLQDKVYSYRVVHGNADLGVRGGYPVQSDGSLKLNFVDYNNGNGFADDTVIQVYVVDPDTGNQYLVAKWNRGVKANVRVREPTSDVR